MRGVFVSLGACAIVALAAVDQGCGSSGRSTFAEDAGDDGAGGDATVASEASAGDERSLLGGGDGATSYDDFPTPVLDEPDGGAADVLSTASALFGPPSQGASTGGPCLVEPEVGSLYPQNWLRPRFVWNQTAGENVFELRIHAANQTNDLVVYTTATQWTMPQAMWNDLRTHSADVPMTVSVRGGVLNGGQLTAESLGSTGPLGVAPVAAPGTIVYWTTSDGTSLKGFQVGDETVGTTLLTSQVQEVTLGSSNCLGCHNGTPDGNYAVFSTDLNNWGNAAALIDPDAGVVGSMPPFFGAGAKQTLMQGPLGINAVSKGHWSTGDHVMVASDGNDLVWIDLEAADVGNARGVIARNGTQTGGSLAGAPAWSHDGNTIAYVATNHLNSGRLGGGAGAQADPGGTADIFTVPYDDREGGTITGIAVDPNNEEYYPGFSPDDAYLAFAKCPNGQNMYNQLQAEVWITTPTAASPPTRLVANDPPACSGLVSPGVTNSWPKWAPAVSTTSDGRSFYWIVFSSTRTGSLPQLFITAMVVRGSTITTYGALYLWNQPSTEGNHTPAWEYFNVPTPTQTAQ